MQNIRFFLALALLTLLVTPVLGQLNGLQQTDSLKQQLYVSMKDSSRVLLLAQISEAFRSSHPDSSMLYSQRALALARLINFPKG